MRITFGSLTRFAGVLAASFCFCLSHAYAKNFVLPTNNEALIGDVEYSSTENGDTTTTIAQRYNLGLNAIVAANPGTADGTMFRGGTPIKVSGQFLLPPLPRRGIVINLPEMRMYYYPEGSHEVMTFPIGIGRIGKTIPIKETAIVRKTVNPTWTPPKDIREFNAEQGITLPTVMPAGPDNPLGPYAIYLGIPTYLIHSTIFPESIGRRASFGCIRMNESDIKQFFPIVKPGISVVIVDMPNKVAWQDNHLYLEAHPPLEERANYSTMGSIVNNIQARLPRNHVTLVNWPLVAYISEEPDGVPHEIGVLAS
jgi:L,D-transpeptidase ErfK/SrfK